MSDFLKKGRDGEPACGNAPDSAPGLFAARAPGEQDAPAPSGETKYACAPAPRLGEKSFRRWRRKINAN